MNIPPYPRFDGSQPCATTDPEVFFPEMSLEGTYLPQQAKRVCGNCEFREPCLEYALAVSVVGIWGGTTDRERALIRRRRNIIPIPLVNTIHKSHYVA